MMIFTDEFLEMIYVNMSINDINDIKNNKSEEEIINDILIYLVNGDITKLKKVKKMNFIEVLNILRSNSKIFKSQNKLTPLPKIDFKK